MSPILALIICVAFILLLLSMEHNQNRTASSALWIPTLWMLICGSRPVGDWFQYRVASPLGEDLSEAGSPIDRIVLGGLILLALYIIYRRKIKWSLVLKDNSGLVFLFIFSGLSILWSDFPFISLRRWMRLAGVIPVAIVILSELNPLQALESVIRRCTYVLLPLSIVLIKYYPYYGREYGRWSGRVSWSGVTLQKNALGQLCMLSAFFLVWEFFRELQDKRFSRTRSIKTADGLMIVLAIFLLFGLGAKSGSMTSILTLIATIFSMLCFYRMKNRAQRVAIILICAVAFTWIFFIVEGSTVGEMAQAIGRDASFTGRSDLWRMLLKIGARHPLLGAGFGGYFGTPGNEYQEAYGYVVGHNGLLDVYVELGIAGVILVVAFYLGFYRRFFRELNNAFDWGVFGICFLILSWVINFSESVFLKSTAYVWSITVLLLVVFSRPYLNSKRDETNT